MAAIVIAICGLIVVVLVHISIIARWSGRVDHSLESISSQISYHATLTKEHLEGLMQTWTKDTIRIDAEIVRLREARHKLDGIVQRHDGSIRTLETAMDTLEGRMDRLSLIKP